MKKILFISLPIMLLIGGCKKSLEESFISTFDTNLDGVAKLKINVASVYRANPSFQIKLNDVRVSGLMTARTPFPGGGYNTGGSSYGDYISLPVGSNKITLSIPKVGTNVDSLVLFEGTTNLAEPKNYSLHITDTAASTKTVLLDENLALQFANLPHFKLVNLMPNVPAIDLYFGATLVAPNIAYLKASPEFTVDIAQTATAWTIREAGSAPTSTALATYTSGSVLTPDRKFTAFAMGFKGITLATDPRRPFISFYITR